MNDSFQILYRDNFHDTDCKGQIAKSQAGLNYAYPIHFSLNYKVFGPSFQMKCNLFQNAVFFVLIANNKKEPGNFTVRTRTGWFILTPFFPETNSTAIQPRHFAAVMDSCYRNP